jgi:hypothetical protein
MATSVQSASGTAKEVNACLRNSKTSELTSEGSGALSGTVVSVEWATKANQSKIIVQPQDAQAA